MIQYDTEYICDCGEKIGLTYNMQIDGNFKFKCLKCKKTLLEVKDGQLQINPKEE